MGRLDAPDSGSAIGGSSDTILIVSILHSVTQAASIRGEFALGFSLVIVTTTPEIMGRNIQDYLGIVTGEAVMGANIFRDMFAGLRDIVGGRSGSYEKELRKARQVALDEMTQCARDLGADAVVGVDLDYEVLGGQNGMLMVSISGTAVKLG